MGSRGVGGQLYPPLQRFDKETIKLLSCHLCPQKKEKLLKFCFVKSALPHAKKNSSYGPESVWAWKYQTDLSRLQTSAGTGEIRLEDNNLKNILD